MFDKKVVVITGAGSGIGRALALEFSKRGARLALSDINTPMLNETLALLPVASEARIYSLDVSSRKAVYEFADVVVNDFGSADFIINNAGTSVMGTVEHVTIEEMERVIDINLWGVIYGTKAFLPIMLKQKTGCIVNVSSVYGIVATPCSVAYTITKFGVRGLTETLWQELKDTGVRAVLVHPGGINTNISKLTPQSVNATEFERRIADLTAKQMITTPEECAQQIVRGLEKGKKRLLVGSSAKALHWLARLFPDSYGEKMRRKAGF